MNALADADVHTLRISIDTKATVHVGEYSRGGRSRGLEAVKALDHYMCMKEKLVPGGILEPVDGKSFLFFGTNYKTSDFMADGLFYFLINEAIITMSNHLEFHYGQNRTRGRSCR